MCFKILYFATVRHAALFLLLCFHPCHWSKASEDQMLPAPISVRALITTMIGDSILFLLGFPFFSLRSLVTFPILLSVQLEGWPLHQHCQPIKQSTSFKETTWLITANEIKSLVPWFFLAACLLLSALGLRFLKAECDHEPPQTVKLDWQFGGSVCCKQKVSQWLGYRLEKQRN